MSSVSSAVTYTSVYIDSEPGRVFWGANKEVSDSGSPRIIVLGYDGLPIQPVAPPSLDYILDSEEPQTPPVPQEKDEHEFLVKEHPLPPVVSPTAESPRYACGRLVGSRKRIPEGEDKEVEVEAVVGDSAIIVLLLSLFSPPEGEQSLVSAFDRWHGPIYTFITTTCAITITTIIWVSNPNLDIKNALPKALDDAVTAALPSPLLPPLPPSLYIPPPVDHRDDIPESERPPRKRSCLFALGSRYEVGESSTTRPTRGRGVDYGFVSTLDAKERRRGIRKVGYGIRDTWVDPAEAIPKIAPMTVGEVNTRVIELAKLHEHDMQDLYALLEDAHDSRTCISQRVTIDSQRVDLLMGDMMTLQEMVLIVEEEAYAS
ncbi:hypothetical protein Tco_0887286 [Tanacetum coccineum]